MERIFIMALKLSTNKVNKEVSTTGKGPDWYRHEVAWLKDVTSENSNESFGIKQIFVFPPTDNQFAAGIVAKVGIRMNYCFLKGTIFANREHNTLSYVVDGSEKYVSADGEVKWYHPYDIDPAIKAQVLRHVESLLEEE